MEAALHVARAEELTRSLGRLGDGDANPELRLELVMLASTHLLNAVLHTRGISEAAADQEHADMPAPLDLAGSDLAPLVERLRELEEDRAWVVRGASGGEERLRRHLPLLDDFHDVLKAEGSDGRVPSRPGRGSSEP